MAKRQSWVEALNISSENLNEWSAKAPPGKPMLVWCLEEGLIDVQEYLIWASENYGLAILSSAFFESESFSAREFLGPAGHNDWHPWSFPVGQWDGITFVASALPPADDELESPNLRYILADPRVLREIWESSADETPGGKSQEAVSENADGRAAAEGPTGITIAQPGKFQLNLDDANILARNPFDHDHAEPNASQPSQPTSPPSAPAQESSADEASHHLAPDDKTPVPMAAPILNLDDAIASSHSMETIAPEPATDEALSPVASSSAPPSAPPPSEAPAPLVIRTVSAKSVSEPPPKPSVPSPIVPHSPTSHAAIKTSPSPSAVTALESAPSEVVPLVLNRRNQTKEEDAITKTLVEIRKSFTHTCVLKCKDSIALLYRWDPSLNPADPAKVQLNQGFPSFLRIVTQTLLPYHGYLVDTPTHREFFRLLGSAELPECVTAVPLKQGDVLLGVLLAIGEEKMQAMENLKLVEEAAENLMTSIGTNWLKAS